MEWKFNYYWRGKIDCTRCLVEETWKFSAAHMKNSLRLSSKCEEHFFNSSLRHTSQRFLSLIIPFTGTHEPNKLTCSQLSGFIAQWEELHKKTILYIKKQYFIHSCYFFFIVLFPNFTLQCSTNVNAHCFITYGRSKWFSERGQFSQHHFI